MITSPGALDVFARPVPLSPPEAAFDRALAPFRPSGPLRVRRASVEVAEQHHRRCSIASHSGLEL